MDKKEFATNSDILRVHDLLLPGKLDFEQDKIEVIKCNNSRDVTACPGSGKTTVLLAKLLVLAEHMPFIDGSGICVITHTNVAINEIKSRFSRNANVLFSYPNFCGTIQSFVDQFLTIPWYNSFSDKQLVTVDDDRAKAIIKKEFYEQLKGYNYKNRGFLYSLIERANYPKIGGTIDWKTLIKQIESKVEEYYYNSYEDKFYRNYGDRVCIAANNSSASERYQFFSKVILRPHRYGVLRYIDAYSFASKYILSHPDIRQSLSERFKYVFIDEAQDSNQMQLDLIDGVFDLEKVVVQRFGDPNQSLYDDSELSCAWVPRNPLQINNSKRFGAAIAKVLQTVCVNDNMKLQGNEDVSSVKPIMIVYKDASTVLHSFVNILKTKTIGQDTIWDISRRERNMDSLHRYNIKAIGHVGNKKDEIENFTSIKQYFPEFENDKVSKYPFRHDMTLNSFLQKDNIEDTPSEYRNSIIDAFVASLERVDVTNDDGRKFNKTSLLECIRNRHYSEYEKLMNNLSTWVMEIASSELKINPDVFDKISSYIETDLASMFGFSHKIANLSDFLKKESDEYYDIEAKEQSNSIYREGDVEVEVATVHSVKGETHAATLYLETKYYAYESEQFGDQLCGKAYTPRKGDSRIQERLKVAYVGMSRPKYLLAYAIKKERFQAIDCNGLREIWDIQEV